MRKLFATLLATTLLAGCTDYDEPDHMHSQWAQYDYDHPDPTYGGYEADRYYRDGDHDRLVARDERIYRGRDGRYYCRPEIIYV